MTSDGEQPVTLAVGMELPSGATLSTGAGTRVMLVRGAETMMVGPKSVIAVSEHPTEGLTTTVLEKTGEVQFDVEKQNVHYFSVETPMLAAVVKGTHFTVGVDRASGGVKVARGTVEVTALATGQMSEVTAGQHARVDGRGMSVGGMGHPSISVGQPRASVVSAMTAPSPTVSPTAQFTQSELSTVATVSAPAAVSTTVASPTSATASNADHSTSSARTIATTPAAVTSVSTASVNATVGAAVSALGMAFSAGPTVSTGTTTRGGAATTQAGPAAAAPSAPGRLSGLLGGPPTPAAPAGPPSAPTPHGPPAPSAPTTKNVGVVPGRALGLTGGPLGQALGALANAARGAIGQGIGQSGVGGLGGLGAGAFGRGR